MKKAASGESRGFTLIETVIVVAVFAIILAGIWMVVNIIYQRVREHQASAQVQTIVHNFRQLYSRVGELSGSIFDYTALLDSQDAFPQGMRANQAVKNGKINHPWSTSTGGSVTVNSVPSEGDKFEVHLVSLPKKACSGLAQRLTSGELSGIVHIKIDSGSCYGTGCTKPLPIGLVDATNECKFNNGATGTGQNDIIFRLSIRQ